MSRPAVVTIAAGNYLPHVRVLRDSLGEFHPDLPFFLALAGPERQSRVARAAGLEVIGLQELAPPDLKGMMRRYDAKAICAASKPTVLRHLLDRGFAPVLFIDPDILVTGDLTDVITECSRSSLTLIPHWNRPPAGEGGRRLERQVLLAGIYNGGFIGAMPCEDTNRFLSWWESRLRRHCLCDVEKGIHFDQRWLDLAPGFVADLHLLRDPSCNVAYWNLEDRHVELRGGQWLVDESPLRFFHFSGFNPGRPELVTSFQPDWLVNELGPAGELFRRYGALLCAAGWAG